VSTVPNVEAKTTNISKKIKKPLPYPKLFSILSDGAANAGGYEKAGSRP